MNQPKNTKKRTTSPQKIKALIDRFLHSNVTGKFQDCPTGIASLRLRIYPTGTAAWHVIEHSKQGRKFHKIGNQDTSPEDVAAAYNAVRLTGKHAEPLTLRALAYQWAKTHTDKPTNNNANEAEHITAMQQGRRKFPIKLWSDSYAEDVRKYIASLPANLMSAYAHTITREQVHAFLDTIENPYNRKRLRTTLKSIFDYAVRYHDGKSNPAFVSNSPRLPRATEPRYAGSAKETGLVIGCVMQISKPVMRDLLLFIAVTSLRLRTARLMRWEYISFETGLIHIPAELMKAKLEHCLPITTAMRRALARLKYKSKSVYLFPSTTKQGQPIREATVQAALRRATGGMISPHGFRHLLKVNASQSSLISRLRGLTPTEAVNLYSGRAIQSTASQMYEHGPCAPDLYTVAKWWEGVLFDAYRRHKRRPG